MSLYSKVIRPVSLAATQLRRLLVRRVDNVKYALCVPAFSKSAPNWNGSSYITIEFVGSVDESFSLLKPLRKPTGVNYCLAIRWEDGEEVVRYKLWEDVDERLYAPLYNGEKIPENFVLEVWSVESSILTIQLTELQLLTSLSRTPLDREETSPECITLTANELLYGELPWNANFPLELNT